MASDAGFISVQVDIDEAMKVFEGLDKGQNTIRRHLLAGIGTSAKNRAKTYSKTLIHKRSGALYKSFKRKIVRSGKAAIIEAKARAANQVFYGYALAKGATIKAKHSDYLTFQIDGKWVKKKEVKLPARDYITEPVKKYIDSAECKLQMEKLVQREIAKLEKKGIIV